MPTVHNSVRMAPINTAYANQYANQVNQTPRTLSTMMSETPRTTSTVMETPRTGMPPRVPNLSGRYALCCELGQRIGLALELTFSGFPEMKISGGGQDQSKNRYAIAGFWHTNTNAFQLSIDLVKLGKITDKSKPRVRAYPTIQLFGIREPHGVRFSGEAHCCLGLGPFGLKSVAQLKADKKFVKNRMAQANYAVRGQARPGNTLMPMATPRTQQQVPLSARPRAMTASAAQMTSARGSGYFSPPGAAGAREFRANPHAFQQAHAHSQRAAQAQAQARARAMTGLTSPQYDQMRRQQTHTFGDFGDVSSAGLERDHSADGFDDEAFEALLMLSPNGANPNRLAAQKAALAQFAAQKEAHELASTIKKSKEENSTAKPLKDFCDYDFDFVEETHVDTKPQKEKSEAKPQKKTMMYGIEVDDNDSNEPPLPGGDSPAPVSPRPEWMDEVFDDFEDGMTLEL